LSYSKGDGAPQVHHVGHTTEPGATLNHLSSKLTALSSGKLVLAALALFVLFMLFVLPAQAEVSSRQLAGVDSPDMSFIYSADDIYGWAEAYGADGRDAYVRARWSFDLVWPLAYGFFLITAISWVGPRAYRSESWANRLNLIPIAAVLFDYTENVLTSIVMLRYPNETIVAATLASPVTIVKWLFVGGGFVVLLLGVLAWTWRVLSFRLRDYNLRPTHGKDGGMKRVTIGALLIGVVFLTIVINARLFSAADLLIALLIVLVTGFVPFSLGSIYQVLMGHSPLPLYVPWLLGVALGTVRLLFPQLGGFTVAGSTAVSVMLTIVLAAGFAELGAALIRLVRHRQRERLRTAE